MRKVILLSFFLIAAFTVKAQFKIGLTAYPQLSSTSGFIPFKKNVVNNTNLPTLTGGGGIVAVYDSRRKPIGAQLGITYSGHNQSFRYNYTIGGEKYSHQGKKRFDYVKFSLVGRKFWQVSKHARSVFFLGPQFSYLLKYDGGAVVYDEDRYFDLPATDQNIYYKKYSIDAVIGWGIDYAVHRNIDLFAAIKIDYGLNNIEQPNLYYNDVKVFEKGGTHQMACALTVGAYYVFNRPDHLLLPTNSWRFRDYKNRKYKKK
jgi:hypothetical protein